MQTTEKATKFDTHQSLFILAQLLFKTPLSRHTLPSSEHL